MQTNFLPIYLLHSKGSLISGAVTEEHQNDPAGPDQAELIQCPVPRTVALPQDALGASVISGSEATSAFTLDHLLQGLTVQCQLQPCSAHLGDNSTAAEGSLPWLFQEGKGCPEVTLVFCNEGDLRMVMKMLNHWDKLFLMNSLQCFLSDICSFSMSHHKMKHPLSFQDERVFP